jgi:DNA-binding beta-propeller fold protein YncE
MKTTLRPHFRIRTKFALASTMLLLSMLFALPRARSGEEPRFLYATAPPASGADTLFVRANLEAKRVRVLGNTGYPFSAGLAFCPSEGEDQQDVVAYTIVNTFDPTAQLAKLDQRTGEATLVGSPHGQGLNIMGMTCSPDGTLYAIGQLGPTNFNSLYTVDRETGVASLIGSTGVNDPKVGFSGFLMALAFAPDGRLYGVNVSTLFSISPKTGLATKEVEMSGVNSVMGLAIDEDGKFYVADWVPGSKIYTLDPVTGAATPILETHLDYVHNIAFKPHDD